MLAQEKSHGENALEQLWHAKRRNRQGDRGLWVVELLEAQIRMRKVDDQMLQGAGETGARGGAGTTREGMQGSADAVQRVPRRARLIRGSR